MNLLLLFVSITFFVTSGFKNKADKKCDSMKIVKDWVQVHNKGSREDFVDFINKYYSAETLNKADYKQHVEFYSEFSKMYGELQSIAYKEFTQSDSSLKVWFLKKGVDRSTEPAPTDIIVVTAEYDENCKMHKSLGLSALVCELRK